MEDSSQRWQWSLRRIQAPQAWNLTRGNRDIIIAVVDSGVDANHPELAGRVLKGHNVVTPQGSSQDDLGHGTAVAGLIAAKGANSRGFAGLSPECRLLPVKVNQPGTGEVHALDIARGIRWAAQNGARVINASVGVVRWEHGLQMEALEELQDAIRYALARNITVVCAAGPPVSPSPFPGSWSGLWDFRGLMAVGGVDRNDRRAGCSPASEFLSVTAPSDGVLTCFPGGPHPVLNVFGGTSAAAPHVSGLIGLILSLRPELRPFEIKALIQQNADRLTGDAYHPEFGHGRINAFKAVQSAAQGRPPVMAEGARPA